VDGHADQLAAHERQVERQLLGMHATPSDLHGSVLRYLIWTEEKP
jgi:hypothetical protein